MLAVDGGRLRYRMTLAFLLFAAMALAGLGVGAVLSLLVVVVLAPRYVAHQWRMGRLLADDVRLLAPSRIPDGDLREAPPP